MLRGGFAVIANRPTPAPYKRTANVVNRELRECTRAMMYTAAYSRAYRSLALRHKALALELALTTGALSLGAL